MFCCPIFAIKFFRILERYLYSIRHLLGTQWLDAHNFFKEMIDLVHPHINLKYGNHHTMANCRYCICQYLLPLYHSHPSFILTTWLLFHSSSICCALWVLFLFYIYLYFEQVHFDGLLSLCSGEWFIRIVRQLFHSSFMFYTRKL